MRDGFKGKQVLVTGGASGIGAAVARSVAEQGGQVTIADRDAKRGTALAKARGGAFHALDVADEPSWHHLMANIPPPDFVHLNAGIMSQPSGKPLADSDLVTMDIAAYRRLMAVNVDGVVLGVRAVAPKMFGSGGTICVTASMAGLIALPFNVLRQAMSGFLPPIIAARKKQGFSAPDESWYRGENAAYVRELLLNPKAAYREFLQYDYVKHIVEDHIENRANHRPLIWSFLCFEWWCKIFLLGEKMAAIQK